MELSSNGKLLRQGYTTGSCATAAAKIALMHLCKPNTQLHDDVEIRLPNGTALLIPINNAVKLGASSALGSVLKDAGDDQDVTQGLEIRALVTLIDRPFHVEIIGGKGVGKVTKTGLQIPVGHSAINPVPLQMIKDNLLPLLPQDKGCHVEIIVPEGEAVALKTFNPRLGIIGGISIIGTSGIVRPMSEEAYKQTIFTELSQKNTLGVKRVVLVPGMHGEKFALSHLGYKTEQIVHISNFIGYALKACEGLDFEEVILVGHVGKFIKLSGGIFHTHSKIADAKKEILIAFLALSGAPLDLLKDVNACNTTDEMSLLLLKEGYAWAFEALTKRAKEKCIEHAPSLKKIEVVFYDMALNILGNTLKGGL